LMEGADGVIYRLNKRTGQVAIINGDTIKPLRVSAKYRKKKEAETKAVAGGSADNLKTASASPPEERVKKTMPLEMKVWSEQQFRGKNLKVRFKSAWADGILHYELDAYPYSSLEKMIKKKQSDVYYQRKWHGFVVKLLDEEGVIVRVIPVKLWDMAKTLDNQGRFSSLVKKDDIELPEDEFIRITSYSLDWKLDCLLIPDYKFYNKIDDLMQTYSWYGEVDRNVDADAPEGAKYWWMTFPDKKKVYFSTEEELLEHYEETTKQIIQNNR